MKKIFVIAIIAVAFVSCAFSDDRTDNVPFGADNTEQVAKNGHAKIDNRADNVPTNVPTARVNEIAPSNDTKTGFTKVFVLPIGAEPQAFLSFDDKNGSAKTFADLPLGAPNWSAPTFDLKSGRSKIGTDFSNW